MLSVTSPRFVLLPLVFLIAALTSGCFQPLYGDRSVDGGANVRDNLNAVEVATVGAPRGTRLMRVGGVVRDELIFGLTGGGAPSSPDYRLDITIYSTNLALAVDPNTGLSEIQNYGIDASYALIELATGKIALKASTFSRVTYNIPGATQRFAAERALRDSENRAAKIISENIRSRLAVYFTSGT